MEKRWIHTKIDPLRFDSLKKSFQEKGNKISDALIEVLIRRGMDSYEQVLEFIKPNVDKLHDPFLMKGMQAAVNRILEVMDKGERILIYGDYDVDGTTAVSLVYSFLKNHYSNLCYYIPDRYTDGYGISFLGIDYAKEKDCKLIIALDCGIKSIDKVRYASEKNIDFIICDHHLPGPEIPAAIAVLDPKQKDCSYPFKELTGCGIGYKLMQAFCIERKMNPNLVNEFVDLLALSIASDMVPMLGENRTFTKLGLQKINSKNALKGIRGLINQSEKKGNLSITDLLFIVGPRINAAGRISNANKVVELLCTGNDELIVELSKEIDLHNDTRRKKDETMTKEALGQIDLDPQHQSRKSTVLFKSDWHKGVVGIVASRVIEKFYRPTIILTQADGKAVGSARSVYDFDIHEALCECEELLEQFGGHRAAAGMTIDLKNLDAFKEKFEWVVGKKIKEHSLQEPIMIDADLEIDNLDENFLKVLNYFEPFGPENEMPIFMVKNTRVEGNIKVLKEKHLKFQIKGENITLDCLFWSAVEHKDLLQSSQKIDICFKVEKNSWNGQTNIQLIIKDFKISGE